MTTSAQQEQHAIQARRHDISLTEGMLGAYRRRRAAVRPPEPALEQVVQHPHWPVAGPYGAPVVVEEEDHQALPARSWLVFWGLSGRRGTYGAAPLCPTHLGRRQSPRRLRAQTAALPRLRAQGETEMKRIKVVHQGTPSVRRKKSASVETLLRPQRTYRCALPGPSSAPGEVAQPNQSGRTVPTTWFI